MKKLIQLMTLSAVLATFALPALAQQPTASPSPAATAAPGGQEDEAAKTALYEKIMKTYKSDQPTAYAAAKEYLEKYPNETDAARVKWLQNFVVKFEKASAPLQLEGLIKEKKYNEAFAQGKQILAKEPENVNVLMRLGYAGYLAAFEKNKANNVDAINYAKSALQKIETGKAPDTWAPFTSKDEAVAYLNYAIGYMTLDTSPGEAIDYLVKAAQNETVKKDPLTYVYLAGAYEAGPYKKETADYERLQSQPDSPEFKAVQERLNLATDRFIDALARAVAYAGTDAKFQTAKTQWMARLTELYKFRHNGTDTGLTDLIASVRNTPLPSPATAPSATTPATTPTSGATTGTDSGTPVGTATGTSTNATGATSTTPTPTATPANTTQPNTTTPNTTTPNTTPQPGGTAKPAPTPTPTPTTPTNTQPGNKPKP